MRKSMSDLTRQIVAAAILSAVAVAAMVAAAGSAKAADMPGISMQPAIQACPPAQEIVVLYDEKGRPTVPGRTEYYYCVTGTVLRPGDIPPPPEYCCG